MKTFLEVAAHLSRLGEICASYPQDTLDELTWVHGEEWGNIIKELATVGPDRVLRYKEEVEVLVDQPFGVFLKAVSEHGKAGERTRILNKLRDLIHNLGGEEDE